MNRKIITVLFLSLLTFSAFSQVGISVSPPRIYFELNPGQSGTQKVSVSNVSNKHTLDLSVTLGDWEYDQNGENVMHDANQIATSCASWLSISQGSYFSLKPGESKDIEIVMTTPRNLKNDIPVHTALLYITQMNPTDDVTNAGANIKVNVRSAVKVYHRTLASKNKKIDIQNLIYNKETKNIDLLFENQGNTWIDGSIFVDLLQSQTGKQIRLTPTVFYTLPGNKRWVHLALPQDLAKGKYTATVIIDNEDQNNLEAAELGFTYE